MSLSADRDPSKVAKPLLGENPRIVVQHTSYGSGAGSKGYATRVAAERIADHFASLVQSGHDPGDMVVLLRRLTNADVYAQALRDRGLPCVVSGGSVFASMPEALMLEQLTRVIANPLETQSLFSVLTSPLFSLTAGDLLAVGGIGGFWHAVYEEGTSVNGSPQLACALRVMGWVRVAIGDVPVARIMGRVLIDSGWLSRKQSEGAEGLASAANALKAIRMVDAIERSGAVGPASAARQFADMLTHAKEAPGALSVSGGDSVRIMTIHASKGLEFPIIAVGEMPDGRSTEKRLLLSSVAGDVYLSLDLGQRLGELGKLDGDTKAQMHDYVLGDVVGEDELAQVVTEDAGALRRRLALADYEAVADEEESKRLLYVALTRAKEALVVSTLGKRSKDNPCGVPKGVMGGVFAALNPTGAGFEAGRSLCDFGGSAPAVLEIVELEADKEEEDAASSESERPLFMIPAPEDAPNSVFEAYKPAREGVFSYSSISDASHGGDLLNRLAASFAVSVDEGAAGGVFEPDSFDPLMPVGPSAMFDGDFWDFDVAVSFDEDRATDLGTAFHRLAQFAVIARKGEGPLVTPPAYRVEALSRTCNLDSSQRARLGAALDQWFGCAVAHEMAGLCNLTAEVPFFVKVPMERDSADAYLEGEIDLLGFDETRAHATVVDYKTGGRDDETADELRRKHVLQAACYAYAIMLQDVQEVDAIFVRVERSAADDPTQPQCVRYHFEQADMPVLAQAIAEAYDAT